MKTFTLLDCEEECDFDLFGLISSTRDYSLAWAVGRALRLHLVRQPELQLHLLSGNKLVFSHYQHSSETQLFRLFRNRCLGASSLKKPFLAPDIKEYDYLLTVANGAGPLAGEALVQRLTDLPAVQYVCQFDPNTLKYRENLIF